jgi:hypothetical protein
MYSLPLTSCPQHIPDTIQHSPVSYWWTASSSLLGWFRKQFLDPFPQRLGDLKVIDILGFFAMIVRHGGVLVGLVCLATPISTSYTTLFKPYLISQIDTKQKIGLPKN